jgi:hypothetical protein
VTTQAFDSGFSNGFGGVSYGILEMITGSHQTYEDGDIKSAINRRGIRQMFAEQICWPRKANGQGRIGGMLGTGTLLEDFLSRIMQYKFERISPLEVRRTDLVTTDQEVFGSGSGDWPLYLARRKASEKKPIFGTTGSEIWYGGKTRGNHANLDLIWDVIETRTPEREVDWMATSMGNRKKFLIVYVDDFDDATAGDLTQPLYDVTDPNNPVLVKKRKNWGAWRGLRDVVEADVLDKTVQVNIAEIRKHVRSEFVSTKTV